MKKVIALVLAVVICLGAGMSLAGCAVSTTGTENRNQGDNATKQTETAPTVAVKDEYDVGVCQLMVHDALDQATQGFCDALKEKMEAAGKQVNIDVQVAGEASLCTTVIQNFKSRNVDLIMGNATPALLTAANATDTIPVLGTSVTDYNDTFGGEIPANVSGTSDAVPFDQQAQMMIDTLGLTAGDKVGVLYCANETNSKIQYEAVKALFEQEGIVVGEYKFSESTELQPLVGAMASECKAVYVPSDNTVAQNDDIVGNICNENKVPVYTSYGGAVCYASLAIDYYQLGVETGNMAAQILLGEKTVSEIEVMTLTPSVVYNKELCEMLGIPVPADQ